MKKILKTNQEIKGNDNIAITGSPGATVYKGDITGEIAKSIIEDPSKLNKHYKGIFNILKNTHPYYSFEPSSETGELIPIPKSKEALENCPLKVRLNYKVPTELRKFRNLKEALVYSYKQQTPIVLDNVRYFEVFLGEQLFKQVQANLDKGEKITAVLLPQKFPDPRPVKIYIEGNYEIGFDYIELGLKRIEDDGLIFSNEKEANKKICLEFKINLETQCSQFRFELGENYKGRAGIIYIFNKLMSALMSGNSLVIKELKGNGKISVSGTRDSSFIPDPIFEELLQKIIRIEDHFHVEFNLPELISVRDSELIEMVSDILESGQLEFISEGGFKLGGINKKGIEHLLEHADNEYVIRDLSLNSQESWRIFGEELKLGEARTHFPKIRLKEADRIKEELKLMKKDELLDIEFEFCNSEDKVIKQYMQFQRR